MNWGDILILGDSFCRERWDPNHWPQYFTTMLTGIDYQSSRSPRGQGFPGASWWSVRKKLINELHTHMPKVLVICHTEPHRIPNDDDWGINVKSVELGERHTTESTNERLPEKFRLGADLYYKEVMSFSFYDWANLAWFKELDELTKPIEKVIHLYCFDGEYTRHTFKKGTTMAVPLMAYRKNVDEAKCPNHLTIDDNVLLAKSLSNLINNYPGDNVRIKDKLI